VIKMEGIENITLEELIEKMKERKS